jgi:hypothetical protein
LYRLPVARVRVARPPQTIISSPDQIALKPLRGDGTLSPTLVAVHAFVAGSYRAPVFDVPVAEDPPQVIISVPVQSSALSERNEGIGMPVLMGIQESEAGS